MKGSLRIFALLSIGLILTGCSLFGGAASEADAEAGPTATATKFVPPTATPAPTATDTPRPPKPTPIPSPTKVRFTLAPTNTPEGVSKVPSVAIPQAVKAYSGPGTVYPLVGTAKAAESYSLVAADGGRDWVKICCVNQQEVWVAEKSVATKNVGLVPIAADIPPPPVVEVAAPPPVQAAAPTAAPDPCRGIGGDGCKFKIRSGPSFADNGGAELRLQLAFIHSGVMGGQAQGSYSVAVFKDGQRLDLPGARSIALQKNPGALGPINYEAALVASQVPGGSVAGTYTVYVLDGSGQRDSKDFTVTVPAGQGLIYIVFDQA